MLERQESGKTYVYRAFDGSGGLLYIGMTKDLVKRFAKHQDVHWIWDVASLTAEVFESRAEAHAVEVAAIRSEQPRWNVMHTANVQQAIEEFRARDRKRDWPTHTYDEWTVLARRLRRLTWPIQYGFILPPLNEAGEIIF